jgi:putative transposase
VWVRLHPLLLAKLRAAIKLLWLALRNVPAKSVRAAFDWKSAMNQFAILFGDRFTQARG